MELKPEGLNPGPVQFSPAWIDGLIDHIRKCSSKFPTQTSYSQAININQSYISLLLNGKGGTLSKGMIRKIAIASRYERDPKTLKEGPEGEKAIEFPNNGSRERVTPQGGVLSPGRPKKTAFSKDLEIIDQYLDKRQQTKDVSPGGQPYYIMYELQKLIKNLSAITVDQVC